MRKFFVVAKRISLFLARSLPQLAIDHLVYEVSAMVSDEEALPARALPQQQVRARVPSQRRCTPLVPSQHRCMPDSAVSASSVPGKSMPGRALHTRCMSAHATLLLGQCTRRLGSQHELPMHPLRPSASASLLLQAPLFHHARPPSRRGSLQSQLRTGSTRMLLRWHTPGPAVPPLHPSRAARAPVCRAGCARVLHAGQAALAGTLRPAAA